jgi:hypothetical protein
MTAFAKWLVSVDRIGYVAEKLSFLVERSWFCLLQESSCGNIQTTIGAAVN